MNALCHEGYAVVGAYLIFGIAGIDTLAGGFKQILIQPGVSMEITECKCSYNSNYGIITTDWKWEDGIFNIKLQIPANTTAKVIIPCTENNSFVANEGRPRKLFYENGKAIVEINSGKYHFCTKTTI